MSEGFALCEPIWADGRLVDYRIIEINPALQAMLGVGPEAAGTLLSDGPIYRPWIEVCERALVKGEPVGFEFHNQSTGRWHEIRLTRVAKDRLAQFFFDITERKEAQEHQARLFDELNHRVKNSLTMVSALLQMQAKDASAQVRGALSKAVARVEAISEVHGSLYAGGRTTEIDFALYLETLCKRLEDSLLEGDRIAIEVVAEQIDIPVDQAAPLGMIVNELVTNAVKHAYPPPRSGVVAVHLRREAGNLVLSVRDWGRGTPAGEATEARGLGMKLIASLARQVGATVSRQKGPGTGFEIRLPSV
jgi:two-component sensor histidine kinase